MSKKDALIKAASNILWDEGFEAMSPRKVLKLSGAGQGSLYHHFEGKEELASAAIEAARDEMCLAMAAIFNPQQPGIARLHDYLMIDRDEMRGCRMGRLVADRTVLDAAFAPVIADYFAVVAAHITTAVSDAQRCGDLPPSLNAPDVARSLMAVIQGGYVLARSTGKPSAMLEACEGAWGLLEALASLGDV